MEIGVVLEIMVTGDDGEVEKAKTKSLEPRSEIGHSNIYDMVLTGGGMKGDMKVLGVIMVVIHHAVGLNAQDSDGKSDPYIVLSYTKFSKSLHNTRIIIPSKQRSFLG
ncbi:uncharacterized protein PHACADRAFT_202866 [Phanerochaete carnosa HHB-10118-sp]|uniref:C2 domain-containing protein n=1 Tax=Phanerochaete carnosa (strain HHB-10118-sp) TaxID=650164 RepID=K5UG15_PHACS|nr:uncharacterized protein PHACADRAFT_202866 [Phanerochaete carnosa HHB-10118-sp]EKM48396.1 hypothetical protein PHACADRAFT_202866 [Phanerochaete carnosa HHB-10118-sp]